MALMARIGSFLLGPEGLWVVISLLALAWSARNHPSTPEGNGFLERLWLLIPFLGIPLTFITNYLPGGGGWWWLSRVVFASCLGVMVASAIATSGMDYHDSGNAVLVLAAVNILSLGLVVLVPGTVIMAVVIWWRSRRNS